MRKITLHLSFEGHFTWYDDEEVALKAEKKLREQAMKSLVEGLPGLQQLVLGDYEIPRTDDDKPNWECSPLKPLVYEWDSLRHWCKTVDARSQVAPFGHTGNYTIIKEFGDDIDEKSSTNGDEGSLHQPGALLGYYRGICRKECPHYFPL